MNPTAITVAKSHIFDVLLTMLVCVWACVHGWTHVFVFTLACVRVFVKVRL